MAGLNVYFQVLVFPFPMFYFFRAPDSARVKSKMMYASTKDFFKGYLDGLSIELQASEQDDLREGDVGDAVRASVTRQ